MSDDLIKRLRFNEWLDPILPEAADRIEQLEREKAELSASLDENWVTHQEVLFSKRYTAKAEAKLTKAVEALRVSLEGLNWAKAYLSTGGIDSVEVDHADATVYAVLAELEGKE